MQTICDLSTPLPLGAISLAIEARNYQCQIKGHDPLPVYEKQGNTQIGTKIYQQHYHWERSH